MAREEGRVAPEPPKKEDYKHEEDIQMILKDINMREERMDIDVQMNSLCCFKSVNSFKVRATLNKNIFYDDETLRVTLFVDNANNSRSLRSIKCVLMQQLVIRKNAQNVVKRIEFDLAMQKLDGISRRSGLENDQCVEFDLSHVFGELRNLKENKDEQELKGEEAKQKIDRLSSILKHPSREIVKSR